MEVAQTSPYSHGLWNIKDNWRLYHRAGKADQVRPNGRPVTSHNVAGNTREKQLQMPKEHHRNGLQIFHSKLSLKNKSKMTVNISGNRQKFLAPSYEQKQQQQQQNICIYISNPANQQGSSVIKTCHYDTMNDGQKRLP